MIRGPPAVVWNFALRVLSKFGGYLVLVTAANLFSVEAFGAATLYLTLFMIASFFLFLGLPKSLVPLLIRRRVGKPILYFLSAVSAASVVLGIAFSVQYSWLLPLALAIPFFLFARLASAVYQSRQQHQWQQLLIIGHVFLPLPFFFLIPGKTFTSILWAYALAFIITGACALFLIRKEIAQYLRSPQRTLGLYLHTATPVALVGLAFGVMGYLDASIVGFLSTVETVARYRIAIAASTMLKMIPLTISLHVLTRTTQFVKRKAQDVLHRSIRLSFSTSLLSAIGGAAILRLVLPFFFPKYVGIEPYMVILMVGALFYAVYFLLYTHMVGLFSAKGALLPILVAAAVNVALDFLLIPRYGIAGVAMATVAAHVLAFTMLCMKLRMWKMYWAVYGFSLLPILAFWFNLYGLVLVPVAFLLLLAYGYLTKDDVRAAVAAIRKSMSIAPRKL